MLFLGLIAGLSIHLIGSQKVSAGEAPQVKLANLLRAELEVAEGAEVIVSLVELPPQTTLPTHYHPGEEFVYVLRGRGDRFTKRQTECSVKTGRHI
tara:strand:- start:460 stop:747 length:288 start_codon:yes stop_codon:yes gene_type:complete